MNILFIGDWFKGGVVFNYKDYSGIFYLRPVLTMSNNQAIYQFKSKVGSYFFRNYKINFQMEAI
jgi:hypothetical protein